MGSRIDPQKRNLGYQVSIPFDLMRPCLVSDMTIWYTIFLHVSYRRATFRSVKLQDWQGTQRETSCLWHNIPPCRRKLLSIYPTYQSPHVTWWWRRKEVESNFKNSRAYVHKSWFFELNWLEMINIYNACMHTYMPVYIWKI